MNRREREFSSVLRAPFERTTATIRESKIVSTFLASGAKEVDGARLEKLEPSGGKKGARFEDWKKTSRTIKNSRNGRSNIRRFRVFVYENGTDGGSSVTTTRVIQRRVGNERDGERTPYTTYDYCITARARWTRFFGTVESGVFLSNRRKTFDDDSVNGTTSKLAPRSVYTCKIRKKGFGVRSP